ESYSRRFGNRLRESGSAGSGINVHVPRHAQRGNAFYAIAEQEHDGEVVADRQLAGMKNGAAGHAEFAAAPRALPADRRLGQRVDFDAAAKRAEGLAAVVGEP